MCTQEPKCVRIHTPIYPPPMRATDGTGQQGHNVPRHCWVRRADSTFPGLLLDQRRRPDGSWECYCVWAPGGMESGWVPASDVRLA